MGWFSDQIRSRIRKDDENLENAFYRLSSVVMGDSKVRAMASEKQRATNAVEDICKYYGVQFTDALEDISDVNEQMEYMLRPSGVMRRRVTLSGRWWEQGINPLMCETAEGAVVAAIPGKIKGYYFHDYAHGKKIKIDKRNSSLFRNEAVCFYLPFPAERIDKKGLIKFFTKTHILPNIFIVAAAALFSTLLGALTPMLNEIIFKNIIPLGEMTYMLSIALPLVGAAVSMFLINSVKEIYQMTVKARMDVSFQNALMSRLINLPAGFFKNYSAGDLSGKLGSINSMSALVCDAILGAGLIGIFSVVYVIQIFTLAPTLAPIASVVFLAEFMIVALDTLFRPKVVKRQIEANNKVLGIVYSLFSGIQKIKLGAGEKRAFVKWAELYGEQESSNRLPLFLKLEGPLIAAVMLLGTTAVYFRAARTGLSISQFVSFNVAFGMISGAMISLSIVTSALAQIGPILGTIEPILYEVPEFSEDRKTVSSLSGQIEINNISFRYNEQSPMIINNLSLRIGRGQYIAIVGKTGCGKSTLIRILLGFERPLKGAVFYDGTDMAKLDMKSLRRKIGVVIQNGKLMQGDIYSNITVSAPWLGLDEAWEAARMAGIEDDIKSMPMGMHTIIGEGGGGISGGQKQRLMIARAIAPKPRLLIFDEATSALDNMTQKTVSDSLSSLKCTRIVIAHRLSTIKQCDRIIVLENGGIIEDGKYEDLMKNNGFFAELVRRQTVTEAS